MVGGLVGRNENTITNSYATGAVSAAGSVGSLVGVKDPMVAIIVCYYDQETTGQNNDTGKGEPKNTTEIKKKSAYEDWGFSNIWRINEGISYPELRWQP